MRIINFDDFLNEGLVADVKAAYPKAHEFLEAEMGHAWVTDHCSGNTPEKMMAHLLVSHYREDREKDYRRISKIHAATEKFSEFVDAMEYYDGLNPAIFTKGEWDKLSSALAEEINNRLM